MTQSTEHSFDYVNRAKAPVCSSKPQSLSPLYPKAKALGFTGHFYNERYWQATTYHGLGRVTEAQQQWVQAYAYFSHSLSIYLEYQDKENGDIALNSLRRLWQAHPDEAALAAVAAALGVGVDAARARLTTAD